MARTEERTRDGEGEERKCVSSERMRDWRWGSVCGNRSVRISSFRREMDGGSTILRRK